MANEDSNSKALVATDNKEDIDWTKEFDAEPVTFAMMALTGVDEDDWSMEIDSEPMHFGQDGLGDFDWSNTVNVPSVQPEGYKLRFRGFGIESSSSMESDNSSGYKLCELILWVDSDDEENCFDNKLHSEIQKKTVLNSENIETSFENSPNHLIKDCNLHARNLKQTQNHKSKGTQDPRGTRPVWNNTNRCLVIPEDELKINAIIDSGCSGSMTGDKDKLSDFKDMQSAN
ncbi:hypothetical protein Tco_1503248 [Tanacetum coccineum]